jgi:dTDP-glucose 4,6-dehydratase
MIKNNLPIVVTGCAGFIGSHLTEMLLNDGYEVIGIDKLTYAGKMENMSEFNKINPKFKFYNIDITSSIDLESLFVDEKIQTIINCAAETHVDNSIKKCDAFLQTNIIGVKNILEICKKYDIPLIHFSTDEVYGDALSGSYGEDTQLNPKNPYSASKAAADFLIKSYHNTYGIKYILVRPSNNFGPRQHKEKFIPTILKNVSSNKKIPVYGNGKQVREWTYVRDTCKAVIHIMSNGKYGEIYNISSNIEKENIDIVNMICNFMNINIEDYVEHVKDRPGHDIRYSVNSKKLLNMGFIFESSFINNMKETIQFYLKGEQ